LLHGNNDTAAGWTDVGRAHFILDNLIARQQAVPMLVAMPWGHATPFGGPSGDNTRLFERFLLDDVIPTVDKTHRTAADRGAAPSSDCRWAAARPSRSASATSTSLAT